MKEPKVVENSEDADEKKKAAAKELAEKEAKKKPLVTREITGLFQLPSINRGMLSIIRNDENRQEIGFDIPIRSIPAREYKKLRESFKEPLPPMIEEMERNEKGAPFIDSRGDPIKSKKRDFNDFEYIRLFNEYIRDQTKALAVLGLDMVWCEDADKNKTLKLKDKIEILEDMFSQDEIDTIAIKIKELSSLKLIDLEKYVKTSCPDAHREVAKRMNSGGKSA